MLVGWLVLLHFVGYCVAWMRFVVYIGCCLLGFVVCYLVWVAYCCFVDASGYGFADWLFVGVLPLVTLLICLGGCWLDVIVFVFVLNCLSIGVLVYCLFYCFA